MYKDLEILKKSDLHKCLFKQKILETGKGFHKLEMVEIQFVAFAKIPNGSWMYKLIVKQKIVKMPFTINV